MNLSFLKKIIEKSKRPVILAGSGIAISNTQTDLKKFVNKLSIPVVTAWAHDIYSNHNKFYFGRHYFGTSNSTACSIISITFFACSSLSIDRSSSSCICM